MPDTCVQQQEADLCEALGARQKRCAVDTLRSVYLEKTRQQGVGTGAFKLSVYQQSIDVMLFLSQLKQGDFDDSLKVASTSSFCLASV